MRQAVATIASASFAERDRTPWEVSSSSYAHCAESPRRRNRAMRGPVTQSIDESRAAGRERLGLPIRSRHLGDATSVANQRGPRSTANAAVAATSPQRPCGARGNPLEDRALAHTLTSTRQQLSFGTCSRRSRYDASADCLEPVTEPSEECHAATVAYATSDTLSRLAATGPTRTGKPNRIGRSTTHVTYLRVRCTDWLARRSDITLKGPHRIETRLRP